MKNKIKLLIVGGLLALGGAIPAIARAGGASETSIPGSQVEGASAAAAENRNAVDSTGDQAGQATCPARRRRNRKRCGHQ